MVNSTLTDDLDVPEKSVTRANAANNAVTAELTPSAAEMMPSHSHENNTTTHSAIKPSGGRGGRLVASYGGVGGILDEHGDEII